MSQSQFASSAIDDADLLNQLRFYGEPNLPLLPTHATSTLKPRSKKAGAKTSQYLNDSNREIYIKKLNHYKARAKIESNPSKEYLRTRNGDKPVDIKRISNIYKLEDTDYEQSDVYEVINDEEKDVIELDRTEYVHMVNGATSPLSMSDYDPNSSDRFDDYAPQILSSTRAPSMGQSITRSPLVKSPDQQKAALSGYVKLKDRIELDETVSKYRMDIENILHQSVRRNRLTEGPAASKYLNDEVLDNYKKSPDSKKIMYCPKVEPIEPDDNANSTFFGRLFSRNKNVKPIRFDKFQASSSYEGLRNRQDLLKNEQPNLPQLPSKAPRNSISTKLNNLGNFISDAGLTLAKLLPYLVVIILAVIALRYVHLKFLSDGTQSSMIDEGKLFAEQILETVTPNSFNRDMPINSNEPGLYCSDIKNTKCSGTKQLLGKIIDYLRQRSGRIDCASINNPKPYPTTAENFNQINFSEKCVHLNEIVDHLVSKRSLISNSEAHTQPAIESILAAIAKNPHWEIRLLNDAFTEASDSSQVTYLISLVSSKSYMCLFKEFTYFVYVRAVILSLGVIALVLAYFCFNLFKKNQAARDKEYFDLITSVTGMVEKQYEMSLLDPVNIKPYMAISHIYDSLVAPSERASKKKLWNKIVNFIQDHESRIHLETQFINGEETHVWKWIVAKHESVLTSKYKDSGIGLANSTMITNNGPNFNEMHHHISQQGQQTQQQPTYPIGSNEKLRAWQGSAFNRNDKLVHSPTPCLKIRNMFDMEAFENDKFMPTRIHNDIIEKCLINNMNKTILHIACDRKSKEGCVYIKCAGNDAAGLVYQCLNGAWYNGKLLNVKFLRSDRYLERFPESIAFTQPARPIKIS